MTMTNFDTLKAANTRSSTLPCMSYRPKALSLQGAGFEVRQAEAMVDMVAHALSEGLATKEDVRELKTDLAMLDNKIDTGLAALDNKIDTGLAAPDNRIDTGLAALDAKIDNGLMSLDVKIDTGLNDVTQKLTIRLGGIVVGGIALLEILNRIFPVVPAP